MSSFARYKRTPLNSNYFALGAVSLFCKYLSAMVSKIFLNTKTYFDELSVIDRDSKDADVNNFEHTRIVTWGLILFKREILCSFSVVFNCQCVLIIFFINLSNSFLDFGYVWNSVILDMQRYGHFQKFYTFYIFINSYILHWFFISSLLLQHNTQLIVRLYKVCHITHIQGKH